MYEYSNSVVFNKTQHSELLIALLNRFSSQNEFSAIFEVWVDRHFFVIFGKFGIEQFPKFPKLTKMKSS